MNSHPIETIPPLHQPSEFELKPKIYIEKYKNKLILDVEQDTILEKPKVSFSDIVGQERVKRALQEHIILPILFPQLFVGNRRPFSGIWLYGPSGTGKTLLILACANEIDAPFFLLEAQDLLMRGPQKAAEKVKMTFAAAKVAAPSFIYLDDIVSLMPATQNPWLLDTYARRKLERRKYIPLPDELVRKELIKKQLSHSGQPPLPLEDQEYLIKQTSGFSPAEIQEFVRKACYEPTREAQRSRTFKVCGELSDGAPVYQICEENDPEAKKMSLLEIPAEQLKLREASRRDFERVWSQILPSADELEVLKYEEFTKDFGEEWRNSAYN